MRARCSATRILGLALITTASLSLHFFGRRSGSSRRAVAMRLGGISLSMPPEPEPQVDESRPPQTELGTASKEVHDSRLPQADGSKGSVEVQDVSLQSIPWTVWIFIGRNPPLYTPAAATLREGFQSYGALVKTGASPDSCTVYRDCNQSALEKRAFVVVNIGWMKIEESRADRCGYRRTMEKLADACNAYIILYNTEPETRQFTKGPGFAAQWQAKEIWSYSMIQFPYWKDKPFITRYFPAGCAQELVVNVSINNTKNRFLDKVGFVGNWHGRVEWEKEMFMSLMPGQLKVVTGVKSPPQWRGYLQTFPMQLNVHASWNRLRGFESLRMASLITNYACTLSTHSPPADEEPYAGIVRFGNASELAGFYHSSLKGNESAIRECQQRSHREYCTRFAPRRLLENLGFDRLLEQIKLHYSDPKPPPRSHQRRPTRGL